MRRYFCVLYHYAEKEDLSKGFWNPKIKLDVTTHISEIIELQFGQKMPCIVLYFKAFSNNCCLKISETCVVNPSFLFGSQQPLFFPHSHELRKNTSVLLVCK